MDFFIEWSLILKLVILSSLCNRISKGDVLRKQFAIKLTKCLNVFIPQADFHILRKGN